MHVLQSVTCANVLALTPCEQASKLAIKLASKLASTGPCDPSEDESRITHGTHHTPNNKKGT